MIGRKADQFIDGQFVWFTGKIEDINDPVGLNRVKVRCFGFYSNNIAVSDLPWATVMMPVTSASLKGVGDNKIYTSKAGHKIEIDNTDGAEEVRITHGKKASYIKIDKDGLIEIKSTVKTRII